MKTLKVAAVSFALTRQGDVEEFCNAVESVFLKAVKGGASLVVLPEYLSTSLENMPGYPDWLLMEFVPFLKNLASQYKMWIVGGTHQLPVSKGADEHFNFAFIVSPDAHIIFQPKIHLIPSEKVQTPETVGGQAVTVFNIDGVRCAVLICYDIEFPELCRRLVLEANVEIVLVPSWTATPAGFWRVRYCALARATENQIFVVQAPLVGNIKRNQGSEVAYGRAGIFSPCDTGFPDDGVLAEGELNAMDVVIAELSFSRLRRVVSQGQVATRADAMEGLFKTVEISLLES